MDAYTELFSSDNIFKHTDLIIGSRKRYGHIQFKHDYRLFHKRYKLFMLGGFIGNAINETLKQVKNVGLGISVEYDKVLKEYNVKLYTDTNYFCFLESIDFKKSATTDIKCVFYERVIKYKKYVFTDNSISLDIPFEILKTFKAIQTILNANKVLFNQLFGINSDMKYFNTSNVVIDAKSDANNTNTHFSTFSVRMAYLSAGDIERKEYDEFLYASYSILEKMLMNNDVALKPSLVKTLKVRI